MNQVGIEALHLWCCVNMDSQLAAAVSNQVPHLRQALKYEEVMRQWGCQSFNLTPLCYIGVSIAFRYVMVRHTSP